MIFALLGVLLLHLPSMAHGGAEASSSTPPSSSSSSSRDVLALSKWAKEQGIVLHQSLQLKRYGNNNNNWGLELDDEPVPAGTTLLRVPRHLVLDADAVYHEFLEEDPATNNNNIQQALERLGEFQEQHRDGFLIFLKLLRCCKQRCWSPWIRALPQTFPVFSEAEKECLPFYARYAADYQDQKFQAFCQAAAVVLNNEEYKETSESESDEPILLTDPKLLRWAFHAVNSRFWKTAPINSEQQASNTELVPVGDMFNHGDPPNVAITHDESGSVNFVYKGDTASNKKDLYITYGQPSNPHRFLVIFGFVPQDMPYVWSHIAYPNNPFSANVSEMVFRTSDGRVPKIVWDAVLYALLQPPPEEGTLEYTLEQHAKYKRFTLDILKTHVAKQLKELSMLRQKIDASPEGGGENMDLIRQHNEFLTTVFLRVQAHLDSDSIVV